MNPIAFTVINNYAKSRAVPISTVLVRIHDAGRRSLLSNGIFETFIEASFSESVISKIHQLWVSSFYVNSLKFNVDFKNAKKNWDNVFSFSDNIIWIDCVKLSLLRREYLSRAVIPLTNTSETSHISKRDLSQPNCLHNDQWISQRWCPLDFNSACSLHHPGRRSVLWNRIF